MVSLDGLIVISINYQTKFISQQEINLFIIGPYSKNTHWKQVIFYTEKDVYVEKGEVVKGSIAVRKNKTNFRELDIKISFHLDGQNGKSDNYQLFKLR